MVNNRDTLLTEMQAIVRFAAEPRPVTDSIKGAIRRASRALGISYRRSRSFWYGCDRAKVTEAEAARLRAERDRLLALRIECLDRELAELRAEMGRLDAEKSARLAGREAAGSGQAPLSCCWWGTA